MPGRNDNPEITDEMSAMIDRLYDSGSNINKPLQSLESTNVNDRDLTDFEREYIRISKAYELARYDYEEIARWVAGMLLNHHNSDTLVEQLWAKYPEDFKDLEERHANYKRLEEEFDQLHK